MGKIIHVLEVAGKKRPIEDVWHCRMSGDCCRAVRNLVMSKAEADLLIETCGPEKAATLHWINWPESDKVALKAGPCPMLDGNLCSVYAVRPYNCRRWGCFRPDPKTEPLEPDMGFLGSPCTRERWTDSRGVRRQLIQMQRKAQRWARAHGWTDETTLDR